MANKTKPFFKSHVFCDGVRLGKNPHNRNVLFMGVFDCFVTCTQKAQLLQAFFLDIFKKTQAKKTQVCRKLKEILARKLKLSEVFGHIFLKTHLKGGNVLKARH